MSPRLAFVSLVVGLALAAGPIAAQPGAPPREGCDLVPRASEGEPVEPESPRPETVTSGPGASEPLELPAPYRRPAPEISPVPTLSWIRNWYGYQLMLSDLASVALAVRGQPEFGFGLYIAGPATVHALHKQRGLAAASMALRLVLPLLALVANANDERDKDDRDKLDQTVAAGIGIGTAMLIDWCLAHSRPSAELQASMRAPAKPRTVLSAGLVPTREGAQLVLGGRF